MAAGTPALETNRVPAAASGASLAPEVTRVSTEFTDIMSKFTAALSGVKDAASAEAALPKLEELNHKLDDASRPRFSSWGTPEGDALEPGSDFA